MYVCCVLQSYLVLNARSPQPQPRHATSFSYKLGQTTPVVSFEYGAAKPSDSASGSMRLSANDAVEQFTTTSSFIGNKPRRSSLDGGLGAMDLPPALAKEVRPISGFNLSGSSP